MKFAFLQTYFSEFYFCIKYFTFLKISGRLSILIFNSSDVWYPATIASE